MTKIENMTQAAAVASDCAHRNDFCESKAVAVAETWFDAGKDFNRCDQNSLDAYLEDHFGRQRLERKGLL